MKTVQHKITKERLREIITEELHNLHEQVDHEGIKQNVSTAASLLKALHKFSEDANTNLTNATTPHVATLLGVLEDVVSNPGSYVDRPKVEPKHVKLRKVDD